MKISIQAVRTMTPKTFAEAMKNISDMQCYFDETLQETMMADEELRHILADGLMTDLLVSLGYSEGVQIFERMAKWYS